jgi:Bacterial-like globin
MQTVFEAAGGNDGLRRLADAWHRRVMADDVVAHAFSHGFHPQHVERLAAYWAEALGGPSTYSDSYGDETTVVKMHSGNGEHDEMDRGADRCPRQTAMRSRCLVFAVMVLPSRLILHPPPPPSRTPVGLCAFRPSLCCPNGYDEIDRSPCCQMLFDHDWSTALERAFELRSLSPHPRPGRAILAALKPSRSNRTIWACSEGPATHCLLGCLDDRRLETRQVESTPILSDRCVCPL